MSTSNLKKKNWIWNQLKWHFSQHVPYQHTFFGLNRHFGGRLFWPKEKKKIYIWNLTADHDGFFPRSMLIVIQNKTFHTAICPCVYVCNTRTQKLCRRHLFFFFFFVFLVAPPMSIRVDFCRYLIWLFFFLLWLFFSSFSKRWAKRDKRDDTSI